jgi:hypothetical protein
MFCHCVMSCCYSCSVYNSILNSAIVSRFSLSGFVKIVVFWFVTSCSLTGGG